MTNIKAELIYYEKEKVQGHYILEMAIYRLGRSARYPDGIKYGLIFIDTHSGRHVLMDNHHPKGPHTHLSDVEIPYQFINVDELVSDFEQYVRIHMGVIL